MQIIILPDEVASQIAAGEVVERPASVVKELLENALDAGADEILIKIEKAGKKRIEVMDNGIGIPLNQMALAVSRHATSKLRSAEDLHKIKTLGFRGEALASIGSVSHMTLLSRTEEHEMGGRIEVHGGQVNKIEYDGMPVGTTVRVRDLFFNVPARLKFLKTDHTERRRIDEFITRYATAYEGVSFDLQHDSKTVLQTSGNGDRREVLASLYGLELAKQMLEVSFHEGDFHIEGYISPISLTRSNRREITFFINGRWVQDNTLTSSLLRAYQNYLMVGRYPVAFLFVRMPPALVDVNVHPAKAEVRFQDSGDIFRRVQRSVRRALMSYSPVPQIPSRLWHPHPGQEREEIRVQMPFPEDEVGDALKEETSVENMSQANLPHSQIPLLRLIGQIGATYLVAEGPDGLYLIDQHAAHERVLFEKFLKGEPAGRASQALLEPATITLPPEKARIIEEHLPVFKEIGVHVDPFGPNTFRVQAVPGFLAGADPVSIVQVVVEDFEEDETPLEKEEEKRIIARICKRAAVKGGQVLSVEEQQKLLQDLENCQSPRTCPHGRPTMIHLSVDLLEKQFGRRGSR